MPFTFANRWFPFHYHRVKSTLNLSKIRYKLNPRSLLIGWPGDQNHQLEIQHHIENSIMSIYMDVLLSFGLCSLFLFSVCLNVCLCCRKCRKKQTNQDLDLTINEEPPPTYEEAMERLEKGIAGELNQIENCRGITIVVENYK